MPVGTDLCFLNRVRSACLWGSAPHSVPHRSTYFQNIGQQLWILLYLRAEDTGELNFLLFCEGSRACPSKSEKFLQEEQDRHPEGWGVGKGSPMPDTLCLLGPHLHRPVDTQVVQQRVLHLGQDLAEELEYLLSHAWGVLRQSILSEV